MTTKLSVNILLAMLFAGFSPLHAQGSRIVSFAQDGTLTWTNSLTNGYCGLETAEDLRGGWSAAPSPYWNIPITNAWMSAVIPMEEIGSGPLFLCIVSSTNLLSRGETYDVVSNGIPMFVSTDYIDLDKIERISRFRSGIGHDYSDDFESCSSMKHYFQPKADIDWSTVSIRAPCEGTVSRLGGEWAGTQIWIQSNEYPAFFFILFHVNLTNDLSIGDPVDEGQILGTHVGNQTMSDIAVGVNTPNGWKLLSYYEVMTDNLFAIHESRGVSTRSEAIITKEDREADPLACDGEQFVGPGTLPNWIDLD